MQITHWSCIEKIIFIKWLKHEKCNKLFFCFCFKKKKKAA